MSKNKGLLITECSLDLEINESKEDKSMYVTGIFSSHGRRNHNGRVYEESTMKREVDAIMEKIERKCLWGELGHPPNPEINPDQIAIRVESLEWQGQDLYGKAKILDTPKGKIAKTLVKEGLIGISSRGLGTVSEDGTVNEDYQLVTWDLVTDPSNGPSWVNGIYEGKKWNLSTDEEDENEKNAISIDEARDEYYKYIMEHIKSIEKNL